MPSFACIRQQHHVFTVTASLKIRGIGGKGAAGLVGCTAGVYAVGSGGSVCFTRLSYQA